MRIGLATVGTTGDVLPFATLAGALAGRGHRVTATSFDLHRTAFEEAGAAFAAAGPPTSWDEIREAAARAVAARSPMGQVSALRDFHLRDAADHYRTLLEVLPGHDVVLLHGVHSLAEAAARDRGLPYATAVFDPVLLPTAANPPPGMPPLGALNRSAWWLLDRVLARLERPLHEALRAAGSGSAGRVHLFRARSPRLHLVACSPTLAPPPPDLPPGVRFVGAWGSPDQATPLPAAVQAFLDHGPAPMVVTFGSMVPSDLDRTASALAEAAHATDLRVIVLSGVAGLRLPACDHVLNVDQLDHRSLLGRAGVVVHHGGSGTAHAVGLAGVPSVVVPHIGDQAYWAARLHRLGVAPAPIPARRLTGAALADRLRWALAAPVHGRAAELAAKLASEDGVAESVRLLEGLGSAAEG